MPAEPDPDSLRIGTAEREDATRALGEHLAEGRLEMDEYENRVAVAIAAATRADMRPLFDDLPAPHPGFLRPPPGPMSPPAAPPFPPPYPLAYPPPAMPAMPQPPTSHKSHITAGLLQVLLPFGVGRFYTGHTGMGVAQLLVVIFTLGVGTIWPFIDGILLLVNGGVDSTGRRLRN